MYAMSRSGPPAMVGKWVAGCHCAVGGHRCQIPRSTSAARLSEIRSPGCEAARGRRFDQPPAHDKIRVALGSVQTAWR